jgi:hypothetical protein
MRRTASVRAALPTTAAYLQAADEPLDFSGTQNDIRATMSLSGDVSIHGCLLPII